jgi:hypothetical protein
MLTPLRIAAGLFEVYMAGKLRRNERILYDWMGYRELGFYLRDLREIS